ncbi:MAG TPA: HAMP domain-containing histidine kinase [Phaeodactylibacter sp.]|nr:HAMP domain-containing histidine kinase [Phaeodactylibacter sp.]
MDLYEKKSKWKWYLVIAGLFIIVISMVYTNYVASKLADEERRKVEIWLTAQQELIAPKPGAFVLHGKVLESNVTIPMLLVSETGVIDGARNYGPDKDTNMLFLRQKLAEYKAAGKKPFENSGQLVYYEDSRLLSLLKYFPLIQILLIASFIAFGYFAFSNARRYEQNKVWVGMAKETAHQLGTPISAIIGWIEHLKGMWVEDEASQEVLQELVKDVRRLDLIADRFSKIGSAPTLVPVNIYEQMDTCKNYMQRRSPRKVIFDFPSKDEGALTVQINKHLFDWVIENLLRNALDAMKGQGTISCKISEEKEWVVIHISDTGEGIPASKFKTVFQPGYSTKKRGWGLGLSLAKRIIENYHSGRIFVQDSVLNKGTTFTIKLPKA